MGWVILVNQVIAWIDDVHRITVHLGEKEIRSRDDQREPIIYWAEQQKVFLTKIEKVLHGHTLELSVGEDLPMGEELRLLWGNCDIPLYPRAVVRTDWFEEKYTDHEAELGATYTKEQTVFAVWAPTAVVVSLCIDGEMLSMNRSEKGVWRQVVAGDLAGVAYQYEVTVNGKTTRVNDPYAKGMLANSEKSVVMDLAATDPADFAEHVRPVFPTKDAIIYEIHVRDATIGEESGVGQRGKFLGLTEEGTKTPHGFSSGLTYMKELGITHVQFLPIHDFARVDETREDGGYNWGYDPLYFQVPEGSYATGPADPVARISELKQMILAFHEAGLAVVLDVVYNHVFVMEESPFDLFVPGYYFRYHEDGTVSNGTGVGNDFASERVMGRKFILETIDFWLREYRVDGFRFDLMGIMDVETMRQIRARCDREAFPVLLLGEGWDLPTALPREQKAISDHADALPGIRFFNDYFRDTLKGQLFYSGDVGYVNGEGRYVERLAGLVSGSTVAQTINYVECHDNYTLWDRLLMTSPQETEAVRKKMHQLATGLTLLSQGVPFLHAGQEWFRTKQGDGNSYISGDEINQLNWKRREAEDANIAFIRSLIAIRKKYDVFRLASAEKVRRRLHILPTPEPVFGYVLLGENKNFAIFVNPTNEHVDVRLPVNGKWEVIASNADKVADEPAHIVGEFAEIGAYELVVLMKAVNEKG